MFDVSSFLDTVTSLDGTAQFRERQVYCLRLFGLICSSCFRNVSVLQGFPNVGCDFILMMIFAELQERCT